MNRTVKTAAAILLLCASLVLLKSAEAEAYGPQPISYAADFTVYDEAGGAVTLSGLRGTPVVVNLFASWCPPCRAELPAFADAIERWGDRVRFLMVDLTYAGSDTREDASEMLESLGLSFDMLSDDDGSLALAYRVQAIPVTLFVAADGRLSEQHVGMMDAETLEAQLRALAGE